MHACRTIRLFGHNVTGWQGCALPVSFIKMAGKTGTKIKNSLEGWWDIITKVW
jgi:hypothetical protein